MAASSCVASSLDCLQLLEDLVHKSPEWKDLLEVLTAAKTILQVFYRPFLLCARKYWDKDDTVASTLGELVIAIEDDISSTGQVIHSFYFTCLNDGYDLMSVAHFLGAIYSEEYLQSFEENLEKMKPWISIFSDCSLRRVSDSLIKKADLVEFMDSTLEHLGHMTQFLSLLKEVDRVHEPLREMMMFWRNFICFVTLHGLEDSQLEPLFSHAESFTFSAASLSVKTIHDTKIFTGSVSDLQQPKIIRLQPQVHETCVQALIASKLSTPQSCQALVDEDFLRDFVDSLLFYLLAILKNEICLMISLKDQLQMLWEGLISLRTILTENPKLDEKMRDLTRLSLCDAGLVLFSLSYSAMKDGSVKDMDVVSFGDFVRRLEFIKATLEEKWPETSSSNIPKTNLLGFLDSLLKHMMNLTISEDQAGSIVLVINYSLQAIREELSFLRSNFLEKFMTMRHEDKELQAPWDRVAEVAYKAEFLIDSLLIGDIPDSCALLFNSILEEIKIIKADALKILDTKGHDLGAKEIIKRSSHIPSPGGKPMINNMVVGLDDATTSIINRLKRGSSQLQIIPIVGMPGLGKTTLANKIYDDPQVKSHFYKRAWVTVSQQYHKKRLLLEILTCTHSKLSSDISEELEEDLALRVRQSLQRDRYLIVLDDVWYTEVWNDLEAIFPDNKNGSRVLLTSRHHDIFASRGEEPHSLRPLTDDESWDLLKMMLYPGKKDLPSPKLCEQRLQIVEMCRGVPLTIVILAGILANEGQIGWENVLQSLNSSLITSTEQFTATLELSYQNLPENLKPCFLYFGAFPEDHEHIIEDLICQWIAEGFVQENQFNSLEDVANDYMMELMSRSLVIASKQRYMDGVEVCRVHDLLHEFCVRKGEEENFWQHAHDCNEPSILQVSPYLRRLSINYRAETLHRFRLFAPAVRSISIFSFLRCRDLAVLLRMFKLLKVLNLSQVYIEYSTFPTELELLVHLRYLAIQGYVKSIPSSFGNLLNLETFIILNYSSIPLPDTIWNLEKLRYLQLRSHHRHAFFDFPIDNLDNDAKLAALHTLSSVMLSPNKLVKILRRIPNIRKLKCFLLGAGGSYFTSVDGVLVFDFPVPLESLTLESSRHGVLKCQFEFQFPLTVRELTLSGFGFSWSKMSTIQILPNLEVLSLLLDAFVGSEWKIEEEGFHKVKSFELSCSNLVKWTASDCVDCFPSLRKLVLENCTILQEIPSSLGSSTLEVIEVHDCPLSASFIGPVEEEQKDMGNTELKIIVESHSREDESELL